MDPSAMSAREQPGGGPSLSSTKISQLMAATKLRNVLPRGPMTLPRHDLSASRSRRQVPGTERALRMRSPTRSV